MILRRLLNLVCSDLYRYSGKLSLLLFMKFMFRHPGFKYSFYLRLGSSLNGYIFLRPLYWIVKGIHRHNTYKYGISIPLETRIGSGLYIGHFGGIVTHEKAQIGDNCNISHGVTIGKSNRGKRAGYPIIGDRVYIGPGAKVIGNVQIGNDVAIGANCVVIKDVPDNAVVVGIPARVISRNGSAGYVDHTWNE